MTACMEDADETGPVERTQVDRSAEGTGGNGHAVRSRSHGSRYGRTREGRGSRGGRRCRTAARGTAAPARTRGVCPGSGPGAGGTAARKAGSEGRSRRSETEDDWTARRT